MKSRTSNLKKLVPATRSRRAVAVVVLAAVVSLPIAAAALTRDDDSSNQDAAEYEVRAKPSRGSQDGGGPDALQPSMPAISEPLTQAELDSLIFMREEEKLAHDVYVTLGEVWDEKVFSNIASAEAKHQDALIALLDQYGEADPIVDSEVGEFVNSDLQSLFDDLVAQGSVTVLDAYKVGAMVEELDIVDLRIAAAGTTQDAIIEVLARLERGSNNHLRAFDSRIQAMGATYDPSFLDAAEYERIASAPHEQGGHGENGNGENGNGEGGQGKGGHGQDQGGGDRGQGGQGHGRGN